MGLGFVFPMKSLKWYRIIKNPRKTFCLLLTYSYIMLYRVIFGASPTQPSSVERVSWPTLAASFFEMFHERAGYGFLTFNDPNLMFLYVSLACLGSPLDVRCCNGGRNMVKRSTTQTCPDAPVARARIVGSSQGLSQGEIGAEGSVTSQGYPNLE